MKKLFRKTQRKMYVFAHTHHIQSFHRNREWGGGLGFVWESEEKKKSLKKYVSWYNFHIVTFQKNSVIFFVIFYFIFFSRLINIAIIFIFFRNVFFFQGKLLDTLLGSCRLPIRPLGTIQFALFLWADYQMPSFYGPTVISQISNPTFIVLNLPYTRLQEKNKPDPTQFNHHLRNANLTLMFGCIRFCQVRKNGRKF